MYILFKAAQYSYES